MRSNIILTEKSISIIILNINSERNSLLMKIIHKKRSFVSIIYIFAFMNKHRILKDNLSVLTASNKD